MGTGLLIYLSDNNYILTTMSRLVSFLMLLSLMLVVVNTMPAAVPPLSKGHAADCPDGMVMLYSCRGGDRCVFPKEKREALDTLMAHKTKRGVGVAAEAGAPECNLTEEEKKLLDLLNQEAEVGAPECNLTEKEKKLLDLLNQEA